MEIPNLNIILLYIKRKDYKNALDIINITDGHKEITDLLKVLCMSELEDFCGAEKVVNKVVVISPFFSSIIYKNMNLLEKLRKCIKSDKDFYELNILEGKYLEANKYSSSLSVYHNIFIKAMCKEKGLWHLLEGIKINVNLLLFLHQKEVCDVNSYLSKIENLDGQFYVLVKNLCVSGKLQLSSMIFIMQKQGIEYTDEAGFVNFLIDKIDDWKLYEYAIDKNFNINIRNSINFKYYLVIKNKNMEVFEELVKSSVDFSRIAKIMKSVDISEFEQKEHNIFYRYINNNLHVDDISEMHQIAEENPSIFNIKLLIALLVSTKIENNIMLAYFISRQFYSKFEDQYEMKIICLFLARFFCDYEAMITILEELEIKNTLLNKMSYIWTDLFIKYKGNKKIYDLFKEHAEKTYNSSKSMIKQINTTFMVFIEKGLLLHASDLLEARNMFVDDVVTKELSSMKISTVSTKAVFQDILGKGADFIFKKYLGNDIFDDFSIQNIFKMPENDSKVIYSVFNNQYKNITRKDFIDSIIKLQSDLTNK